MVTYRQATIEDALKLAPRLRRSDLDEAAAAYGEGSAQGALVDSVKGSTAARVMLLDGLPIGLQGYAPGPGDRGVIWQVGSPEIERQKRALLVDVKEFVQDGLKVFPTLFNFVHANNAKSIRWLQRIGFTICPAIPYGVRGDLFHPFFIER